MRFGCQIVPVVQAAVGRGAVAAGVAATLVVGMFAVPAHAEPGISGRTERVLANRDGVVSSVVTYAAPLPKGTLPHDPACDELKVVRWRLEDGPARSRDADAVMVAHPGTLAGGLSFDSVARQTILNLKATGEKAEFWGLEHRENCIEDNTGLEAAVKARDYRIAIGYYFEGKPVNGRTYRGHSDAHGPVTADLGLARQVADTHLVITREISSPAERRKKVFVGGHSQGGFQTAAYGGWDFGPAGGGPGKDQIAGVFALDATVSGDFAGLRELVPGAGRLWDTYGRVPYRITTAMLRSGRIPRTLGIGEYGFPAIALAGNIAGIAARFESNEISELPARIPDDRFYDLALQFFLGEGYESLLKKSPYRHAKATNMAVLGALFDDNSQPIGAFQWSLGHPAGGPVVEKRILYPNSLQKVPGLRDLLGFAGGKSTKVALGDLDETYTWIEYDQIDDDEVPRFDGKPYTTRISELTSATEFARLMGDAVDGIDFLDRYENTRHILDLLYLAAGYRGGDLAAFKYPGYRSSVPAINIMSEKMTGAFKGLPGFLDSDETVVVPGATHNDVLAAAAVRNDGRPMLSARHLSQFVRSHLR